MLSSYITKSVSNASTFFLKRRAKSCMKNLVTKARPSKSLINKRFPSKLWPLMKLDSELNKASLVAKSSSASHYWVKFNAPSLALNFWTSPLFWDAVEKIEQALLRIELSGCEKIRASTSVIPPERHKLWLFRGCSSTSSCSSSSKLVSCSGVRSLSCLSCLQISCRRSVSLNVYALRASWSQT